MKFRFDFVTNSSSSSFIIGRAKGADYNVESVYTILKKLYLKYEEKRKKAIAYIDAHPNCSLTYTLKDNYTSFSLKSECYKLEYSELMSIENFIKNTLGWNPCYSYFSQNINEIIFDSYHEYLQYWYKKIENTTDKYIEIPFTICDLRDKDAIKSIDNICRDYDIEEHNYKLNLIKQDVSKNSFLLDWYLDSDSTDKRKRKKFYRKLQKVKKEVTPVYGLLGQICIYSESGNIPECIVEELEKICEYSCNHMG